MYDQTLREFEKRVNKEDKEENFGMNIEYEDSPVIKNSITNALMNLHFHLEHKLSLARKTLLKKDYNAKI